MRVSIDGKDAFEVDSVVVIYEDVLVPGEDGDGCVEFKFSHEGLITDVWVGDTNVGTEGETIEELVDRLWEE